MCQLVNLRMHNRYTSEPRPLLVAQDGIVLQLTEPQLSKTTTLAILQTNELKGDTATKAMSFCA